MVKWIDGINQGLHEVNDWFVKRAYLEAIEPNAAPRLLHKCREGRRALTSARVDDSNMMSNYIPDGGTDTNEGTLNPEQYQKLAH